MDGLNPKRFVEKQVEEIRNTIGNKKALIAVSGGVDSTTCAVLTHMAIGENLMCITIDDGFRREGEPETVADMLSSPPLNLPVKIMDVRERFLNALKGLSDAEKKRKVFRENFYTTLSEAAKDEKSQILVQGTILADIVETKGGIQTQHNVLEQIGVNTSERYGFKVVEPLVSLYKDGVRKVARYLQIPPELSERQPFPGPGLLVRVVGEVRPDKLDTLKRATAIAEMGLAKHKADQYFAAIIDDRERTEQRILSGIRSLVAGSLGIGLDEVSARILRDRATGVRWKSRVYGDILALECRRTTGEFYLPPIDDLVTLQDAVISGNPSVARLLYEISCLEEKKPFLVAVRAVKTKDFITAEVADVPWSTLEETAYRILEDCPEVSSVYYDVTPKPPATIEME
ncbi:MAG: 7-cyano-7-deazaguanine synthase [Candidatus Bathyarchaeota archaeon]|nr:7-cyano-7-deazaguanine synthase [Candidatus Bathyarchaeota archaeon]